MRDGTPRLWCTRVVWRRRGGCGARWRRRRWRCGYAGRGGGAVCRHTGGSPQAWCRGSRAEDTGAGAGVGRPAVGWTWVVVWVGPLVVCDDSLEVVQKVSLHDS